MKHHHNFPPSVEALRSAGQAAVTPSRPRGIRGRWQTVRERLPFIREWHSLCAQFRDAGLPVQIALAALNQVPA